MSIDSDNHLGLISSGLIGPNTPRIDPHSLADGKLYYLASPYSSGGEVDFGTRAWRYKEVKKAVGNLLAHRINAFSPITYAHEPAITHNLPKDAAFWSQFNECFISVSTGLIIYLLPEWDKSRGVADEFYTFRNDGRPCYGLLPLSNPYREDPKLFRLD